MSLVVAALKKSRANKTSRDKCYRENGDQFDDNQNVVLMKEKIFDLLHFPPGIFLRKDGEYIYHCESTLLNKESLTDILIHSSNIITTCQFHVAQQRMPTP